MTFDSEKFAERIRFHYGELTEIGKFMDVIRNEAPNFQPIPYYADLEDNSVFEKPDLLEELARMIGRELTNIEFSNFILELKKIPCKTVKTTLNRIVEKVEQVHDELWDLGHPPEQLFMPFVLKTEIRRRKQSTGIGIDFSTQTLKPILVNQLGHSQIVFSNKHCFGKTYPKSIDGQILVSIRRKTRKSEIACQIIQNLHFRNLEYMRKIIVTDAENSDFLNPDN